MIIKIACPHCEKEGTVKKQANFLPGGQDMVVRTMGGCKKCGWAPKNKITIYRGLEEIASKEIIQ